jgi:hypothetical protein
VIDLALDISKLTPEQREAFEVQRRQEEIAERKALIEADQQRRKAIREERERNQAIAAKVSQEEAIRRQEKEWEQLTVGLDEYQKEDLLRLYELEPQIAKASGVYREDLQVEYNTILQRFLDKGRNMGTMTFIPFTIYVSTTGHGLLLPEGNGNFAYREGTIGAFSSTDRKAERDFKTKELKITSPSMIPKSNLPISNKWTVVIQDKAPEQVGNRISTIKFQSPEELQQQKRKLLG